MKILPISLLALLAAAPLARAQVPVAPATQPAPPKEKVKRAPHDPFFDKPLDAAEIKRQLDAFKDDPALKAQRDAADVSVSELQKLAQTLRPNGASPAWIDEMAEQDLDLRFRVALKGETLRAGRACFAPC